MSFKNRYGITLSGDLYLPKTRGNEPLAAIAISGPFGAVKEQSSGLYANQMAERGFITLAFDPSFTGESSGKQTGIVFQNAPGLVEGTPECSRAQWLTISNANSIFPLLTTNAPRSFPPGKISHPHL